MVEFAVEHYTDKLIEELQPLILSHYEEIAEDQDKIELNPDYEIYKGMDSNGLLNTITVRDDGKLVGYFVCVLHKNIHYKDHVFANNDILFLDYKYRKSTVAYRLIQFAEKVLKDLGVSMIMINMKSKHMFDRLLTGLGYKEFEVTFRKYIGE